MLHARPLMHCAALHRSQGWLWLHAMNTMLPGPYTSTQELKQQRPSLKLYLDLHGHITISA